MGEVVFVVGVDEEGEEVLGEVVSATQQGREGTRPGRPRIVDAATRATHAKRLPGMRAVFLLVKLRIHSA